MNALELRQLLFQHDIFQDFSPLGLDMRGWDGGHPFITQTVEKYLPKLIVEVGSWYGQSACNMANTLKRNNRGGTIICVDTWLGYPEYYIWQRDTFQELDAKHGYPTVYHHFLSNVAQLGLQDYIVPVPLDSRSAFRLLYRLDLHPDLIYLDGSHDEKDVYDDLTDSWSLLEKGLMFGHDWANGVWPGVTNAVKRFVKEHDVPLETSYPFWLIRKG